DVMTLAKALGNGVPIGACLASGKAAEVFQAGNHGTTFGGNPLACSAGLAVIETAKKNKLDKQAQEMGAYMLDAFKKALSSHPQVTDIRGKGLMIGIELSFPCAELVKSALDKGLLINVTAEKVIRLLPPLILNKQEADTIVNGVVELVNEFSGQSAVGL
ncbi:MAG: aminotransferase class III-fold pyridoxal phosphate-dependent enzyme, partial [Gammaproteobacteria bacterium]|nr:aminotransferase class III-fold pyridoxal phosphate-dependent enzyme [Gammaproteobacteria bacterium]